MKTDLYFDPAFGVRVVFDGKDTVTLTVPAVPFSKLTTELDLDDVDRLLAVVDHAVDPLLDLTEFFQTTEPMTLRQARHAAYGFMQAAPGLSETLR